MSKEDYINLNLVFQLVRPEISLENKLLYENLPQKNA